MAKYKVEYADTFDKAMKKLDRRDQRFIIHWIDQHLNNVDFPLPFTPTRAQMVPPCNSKETS